MKLIDPPRCVRCALNARLKSFQQQRQRYTTVPRFVSSRERSDLSRQSKPDYGEDNVRYKRASRSIFRESHGDSARLAASGRPSPFRKNSPPKHDNPSRSLRIQDRFKKANFRIILNSTLDRVKDEVKNAPLLQHLARGSNEDTQQKSFEALWRAFCQQITPTEPGVHDSRHNASAEVVDEALVQQLAMAYRNGRVAALEDKIKYAFYGFVTNSRFSAHDIETQKAMADLRYPTEWFAGTRTIQRTIHVHVGPTNSGKTYQALQRLQQAKSGAYCGPLRLLAHEVFSRMNAQGVPCALFTGEERRAPPVPAPDGTWAVSACTVEMLPLNTEFDVAVIDEIQMIGSSERGWAWTQALLGVRAREVHLCGEERAVPLIRELCASVGDKVEIHRYERLNPLRVADSSLNGDLKQLKKGDCIVSFSVMGIHALRRSIEQQTGRKVATVYGSLPPETRAQQARLFNDPDNDYDFLVASDAIGMGLNLAIKRVIFESSSKFDGMEQRTLSIADLKQIGGRAGRFRTALQNDRVSTAEEPLAAAKGESAIAPSSPKVTAEDNVGLVTTLEQVDYPVVRHALASDPEPLHTAGIFPPSAVVERFASCFPPGTPFSYILTRLLELTQISRRYHICALRDVVWIADLIEPVQGLTIADRLIIAAAPAARGDMVLWSKLLPAYARCVANKSGGSLVDIEELPLELLEKPVDPSREYLRAMERLHKGITAYLWLSYRFAGSFVTRPLAFHAKSLVEAKIEDALSRFSFDPNKRRANAEARRKQMLRDISFDDEGNVVRHGGADDASGSHQDAKSDAKNRDEAPGVDGAEDVSIIDAQDVGHAQELTGPRMSLNADFHEAGIRDDRDARVALTRPGQESSPLAAAAHAVPSSAHQAQQSEDRDEETESPRLRQAAG